MEVGTTVTTLIMGELVCSFRRRNFSRYEKPCVVRNEWIAIIPALFNVLEECKVSLGEENLRDHSVQSVGFTNTELNILWMLHRGDSVEQIAAALRLSAHTIRFYLKNIQVKEQRLRAEATIV
jgi:DNA-binding CsgD family transcriptional regulator